MINKICLLALMLCFLISIATPMETCDDGCHFTEPLITSESIKKWPAMSCITICGNITINEKTDMAQKELISGFQFFFSLVGNVKVENTTYTSLSFLDHLVNLYFDSEIKGDIVIRSNPFLVDVSAMWYWTPQTVYNLKIINNTKLNLQVSDNCDSLRWAFNMNRDVHGNLKDCPCQTIHITPDAPRYNLNCSRIIGGFDSAISISGINETTDLSSFLNLKTLTGDLVVQNTQLQNLSFLENLSFMELNLSAYNAMDIQNNPQLTRLGLSSLKLLTGEARMIFAKNHPDFCITTNELQVFAMHNVQFLDGFEAKLCQDLYRKDGEKVCIFGDLSAMDQNCQHIIGDVIIDSDNEKFVNKLQNVTYIYGYLTIMNTKKLENTYFLQSLKQIAAINYDKLPKPELYEATRTPVIVDFGKGGDDEEEENGEVIQINRTMTYTEVGERGDEENEDFGFSPFGTNIPGIGNGGKACSSVWILGVGMLILVSF
ncbi:hypothetical protein CAEBREN_09730 [Caenorhabditis brenneri]|uniref:Receptor L-domain domain-containing protein n=1 Tax=Caenorhabditis brenneri TaxID=135651 RepID=G0M8S4_CAEBE|nr:hypothetical protein CAEBREN_09730 [Caenorhabditis brenneri]